MTESEARYIEALRPLAFIAFNTHDSWPDSAMIVGDRFREQSWAQALTLGQCRVAAELVRQWDRNEASRDDLAWARTHGLDSQGQRHVGEESKEWA